MKLSDPRNSCGILPDEEVIVRSVHEALRYAGTVTHCRMKKNAQNQVARGGNRSLAER